MNMAMVLSSMPHISVSLMGLEYCDTQQEQQERINEVMLNAGWEPTEDDWKRLEQKGFMRKP